MLKTLEEYPEWCLYYVPMVNKVVRISRGEMGYAPLDNSIDPSNFEDFEKYESCCRGYAQSINKELGVTDEVAKDMLERSMFGWPDPVITKIEIDLLPNIDTDEKHQRLQELMKEREERAFDIVRFVNEYERELCLAIRLAMKLDGPEYDGYDDFQDVEEDDDGKLLSLDKVLEGRMRAWKDAGDRFMRFAARGEERQ